MKVSFMILIVLLLQSSTTGFVVSSGGTATTTSSGYGSRVEVQPTVHPKSDVMELHSSTVLVGDNDYFQRKTGRGVFWDSPSKTRSRENQNKANRSGPVVSEQTKIESLQQFRNFITADQELQRFTVVKFYASWCKTCAKFGLKYDRLVAKHGDWTQKGKESFYRHGNLRFASVEYSSKTLELIQDVGVQKLPTIQIYDASGDLVAQFDSPYTDFMVLSDKLEEITKPTTIVQEIEKIEPVNKDEKIMMKSDTTMEAVQLSYQSRSFEEIGSPQKTRIRTKWWKKLSFGRSVSAL